VVSENVSLDGVGEDPTGDQTSLRPLDVRTVGRGLVSLSYAIVASGD
jgi:hypothetical protein